MSDKWEDDMCEAIGSGTSKPGLTYKEKLKQWRERGGADLELVLASGAVALLDAQWIISHAEAGGVLNHRQALPKEAFLSFADLVEATTENGWLPVAALSHPWLTKDHPDPLGANLARIARALKALFSRPDLLPRLGVFWDFGSLHQHPDPPNRVLRTEEQNALFKQGLGCLGTLYSHPHTWVLRLTSFPDGHKTEDQAEGTNVAKYVDRGWCYTESSWASLTKAAFLSLDLGKMRDGKVYGFRTLQDDCTKSGGRRPPLHPSAFAAELETKSFTNGKDDKPLVKRLYEAAFGEQFGKAITLEYANLGWGDAEAAQLAEVLASGAAPRLETLSLMENKIGDEGCKALAAALGKEGAAPRLEKLTLTGNEIGHEGCKALAAALGKEGAAPSLKTLGVDVGQPAELAALFEKQGAAECTELVAVCEERGIKLPMMELNYSRRGWGDAEAAQLAEVLASGAALRLETLSLSEKKIGDEGWKALAAALGKEGAAPRLKSLDLHKIGDEGCKALAAALGKEGAAPRLESLVLSYNKIGDEGCKALAAALGKEGAMPRLLWLDLHENEIGDEGCKALAAALKEGAAPSLKVLKVDNTEQPELVAVCEERGITLFKK